jgi:hypothetical protein
MRLSESVLCESPAFSLNTSMFLFSFYFSQKVTFYNSVSLVLVGLRSYSTCGGQVYPSALGFPFLIFFFPSTPELMAGIDGDFDDQDECFYFIS